jgi:hypothetical protein
MLNLSFFPHNTFNPDYLSLSINTFDVRHNNQKCNNSAGSKV